MTPKTSTHFRLSAATTEKLAALAKRYGTRTTAVEVAIDRLWQDSRPPLLSVPYFTEHPIGTVVERRIFTDEERAEHSTGDYSK